MNWTTRTSCEAWTRGQEHYCNRCGFVWDINDSDPPKCLTDAELQVELNRRGMAKLRECLK